jgi:4-amino-4-deoxychorismate lyase
MGIELPEYDREEITSTVRKLLELNNMEDGYFRWNVSAGEREIGLSSEIYTAPNTIVFVKALPENPVQEKNGVILKQRRNTPEGTYRLKSHHFLNNVFGKRELGKALGTEGIFLSEKGFVAEGVVSNIFWRKGETLYTPSEATGALNGITRQFVLALAGKFGLNTEEGLYTLEHLLSAHEVFITNSVQEIVALSAVEEQSFPGKDGEISNRLARELKKHTSSLWSRFDL